MENDPLFTPSFENVLGGVHGYDPENPGVTRKNIHALVDWIFDQEMLEMEGATENWLRLWSHVNKRQTFWLKYFLGIDAEIKPKVLSKLTEEELAEFQRSSGS